MKTILVTGGAGFIGSHLCEFLLDKGCKVIAMDNLITGDLKNIERLRSNRNFAYIHHDVSNHIVINEELDFILHFASPASPADYQKIPIQTLKTGSLGTHNTLGLALAKKAKYILASTSEVYGDPKVNPQPESYWGNVNPIGVRGCFSEDTEVLTKEGWKLFKDVTYSDLILTLSDDDSLEYHKPTEIIKERYVGQLIQFKNVKIDLIVTPNHKMHVKRRNSRSYELIRAFEAIRWDRANMKKTGKWKGHEKEYFYIPSVKNSKFRNIGKVSMDSWLEFFGYYITEGCVHIRKRRQKVNDKEYETSAYNILIAQDKKRTANWNKIKECLKKLPFKYYETDDHQFRICNKQLALYLNQFGKSKEKFIPEELKNLSKRQLNLLFNAMMLGDGSSNGKKFYSSSYRLIGDFQEILLKLGLSCTIRLTDKRKTNPVYSTHILSNINKNFLTPLYPKREIVDYDGYVYCVNVPNHIIFVRRNGKAVFCGNCYDEAKRFAEALTMAYHRFHKLDTKIARIFNTYGEKMRLDDGRAIPNFINQALKNEPITIYGDGKQTRSFCHASDLIEGIYKLMASGINDPVNLGNPEEHTILETAGLIKEMAKSRSRIVFKPLPVDDPHVRCPDISKANKELKWQPKVELREGIAKTIEWARKNR